MYAGKYRDNDAAAANDSQNVPGAKPKRGFSQRDYTVGWICAIPLEMAAARAMLDNIHVELPNGQDDRNAYTLGALSGHNVVIACLPSGTYGTTSAALVASQMRTSFPSIRFYLMVGIGGGVPSEVVDIRLGDVVVSRPTGNLPAVVQYDFGKTVSRGRFERTGALDKPSLELLTAASKLQAQEMVEGNGILASLSAAVERYPHLENVFTHPGQDNDILFEAEYDHVGGHTCDSCVNERMVDREVRPTNDPMIHYGTIASGNQVMKHGRTRDLIAKRYNIYCFEMEAAGLMDGFKCLVIRGICDYSDSHKNKKWQGYAAATAAAYAKELLKTVPKIAKGKRQKFKPLVRVRCLQSLSFQNIEARLYNIATAHQETCDWLFETAQFQQWQDRRGVKDFNGVMWIKGKPGTGKSTLMKHAWGYCNASPKFEECCLAAYFFNARGTDLEKTCLGMLRSLVCQLIGQNEDICRKFIPKYIKKEEMHGTNWQWQSDELKDFLLQTIRSAPKPIILFADALDECEENEVREVVSFLEKLSLLAVSSQTSLRILLSSRHYPTITMEKMIQLTVESQVEHNTDIAIYVRDKLKVKDGAKRIKNELLRKAGGIFMWVVLVTEMLNQAFDEGRITAVWKKLREVPADLDEIFRILLEKDNPYKNETLLMFQWVLFTQRNLSPRELYYGIMAGTDPESLGQCVYSETTDEDIARYITNCSRGLVEIRQVSNTAQFIHETVNDFLLRNKRLQTLDSTIGSQLASGSHGRLAECCLAYIEMQDLADFPIPNARDNKELWTHPTPRDHITLSYPFLFYAIYYIFNHAELASPGTEVQKHILRRLVEQPKVFRLLKGFYDFWGANRDWAANRDWGSMWHWRYGEDSTLLYVLSLGGHRQLVKVLLLEKLVDANVKCGAFGNALHAAMSIPINKGTRIDIVQMIVDAGADLNARGSHGGVIHAAITASVTRSKFDYEVTVAIIQILLDAGASPNTEGGTYANALQAACAFKKYDDGAQRESIVEMLINAGADANAKGGKYGSALQAALENSTCSAGDESGYLPVELVQTLLDAGADPNAAGDRYGSPLITAISCAANIVELKGDLHKGYPDKAPGRNQNESPSLKRPTAIIEMLLDSGADVNAPVKHYGTALQAAAYLDCHHPPFDILWTILAAGADVNAENGYYGGALQAVITKVGGQIFLPGTPGLKVMEILVGHGANANITGGPHGSALHAAVKCTSMTTRVHATQLLLQAGADPSMQVDGYDSVSQSVVRMATAYANRAKKPIRGYDDGVLHILDILGRHGAADAAQEKKKIYEIYGWGAFAVEVYEAGGWPAINGLFSELQGYYVQNPEYVTKVKQRSLLERLKYEVNDEGRDEGQDKDHRLPLIGCNYRIPCNINAT
ncbi:hypothetical protein TWF730_007364 [Orbilia blumenaviensis]|uniref:Nucleoside phosphorylase domain-containing protein n=1 Tax=Orbilia blumenaviensis TaxID=1796055 RepID=A0AAV9V7I5_9PEZI